MCKQICGQLAASISKCRSHCVHGDAGVFLRDPITGIAHHFAHHFEEHHIGLRGGRATDRQFVIHYFWILTVMVRTGVITH